MEPLAPRSPATVAATAGAHTSLASDEPVTLAQAINAGLAAVLERHSEALLFGEDIAVKGGVYGVTRGLHARFGAARVFDTLLDETSILGLALGASVSGFLPLPEIQYLAYLHNAEDQLRGEAATLQFFSQGRYRNGMVVRIAGYGYQRGFGGHFHNDDAVGVLRDIPGLVIASPARPNDAAAMLATCAASALVDGSVCVFLEPIALYHTRDLLDEGDEGWVKHLSEEHVPVGSARTYGDGDDLTIVTWANGLYLSVRVAHRLAERGVNARVLDLRWLAPLPVEDILREAQATGRVLVVDETRRTGGVSEGVLAALVDAGFDGRMARVASKDSLRAARRRRAPRARVGGGDRGRRPASRALIPAATRVRVRAHGSQAIGYLKTLVYAALLGFPVAFAAVLFQTLIHDVTHVVWEWIPEELDWSAPPGWYVIAVTGLAGILVALFVRLPGHGGHSPLEGLGMGTRRIPWSSRASSSRRSRRSGSGSSSAPRRRSSRSASASARSPFDSCTRARRKRSC